MEEDRRSDLAEAGDGAPLPQATPFTFYLLWLIDGTIVASSNWTTPTLTKPLVTFFHVDLATSPGNASIPIESVSQLVGPTNFEVNLQVGVNTGTAVPGRVLTYPVADGLPLEMGLVPGDAEWKLLTNLEVEAFLREHDTVIVPTGSTEQHGPHGPLLTDVLVPTEVARRINRTLAQSHAIELQQRLFP